MIGDAEIETLIVAEEITVIQTVCHLCGPRAMTGIQLEHRAESVTNGGRGDEGGSPGATIASEDAVAQGSWAKCSRISR